MPMEQDDGASAPIPRVGKKQLRACMLCSVVLEATEFKKRGCPNCEDVLQLHNDSERVAACTSAQFEGMIALVNPTESWVARWQRIGKFLPGVYAVRVTGRLPLDVQDTLAEAKIVYRPRDQVPEF